MPLYTFHCERCDHDADEIRSISERNTPGICQKCKGTSERGMEMLTVHGFEDYLDENLAADGDGSMYRVKSRADRNRRRKELGLHEAEPSLRAKDHRLEVQRQRQIFLPTTLK